MLKKIFTVILIAAVLIPGVFAQTAEQIINKADAAFTLDKIYSKSILTVTRKGKAQIPQEMENFDLEAADGTVRTLSVFLAPRRVAGTAYLMIGDDLWVRFASTGRVRKMSSSARKNSAAGSDFSYADMGEGSESFTTDYKTELAGTENARGVECWKLELTPEKKSSVYEKMIVWISKEDYLYIQVEFYEDNAAVKRMIMDDYRDVQGVKYPFRITMKSLVEDSVSVIETEEIEPDSDKVQERFFSNSYLRTIR